MMSGLEPREIFARAVDLLADRGFVVVVTPNGATADREREPIVFRVDLEHLQYLAPATCQSLAAAFALDIVHLETYGHPNLFEIGKAPRDAIVTRALASLPGFAAANAVRRLIALHTRARGDYHLLCIFQRSRAA